HLEALEKYDAQLNELVETIAGMIPAIELVKGLAKATLSRTVIAMLDLIEDISLFILNSTPRGSLERAWRSLVSSEVHDKTQAYITKFKALRSEFNTMVGVQQLVESTKEHQAAEVERQATEAKRMNAVLRKLKPVYLASYDPEQQCIPETRTEIIDDLAVWTQHRDSEPSFAWMSGQAGLGKSSIATSLCLRLNGQNVRAASFFCKRDSPELRDPRNVLTTIVYGLALQWHAYRSVVVDAMNQDPEFHSRHLQPLYDLLVAKPLDWIQQEHSPAEPFVVVVDALDECGDKDTRRQLLTCLRNLSQVGHRIKVLVTSRPDPDVKGFFEGDDMTWFAEYDVRRYNAAADIRLYVRNQLNDLARKEGWPEGAVDQLAFRADGLFIWARTACRFIVDGLDSFQRLEKVLSGSQLADIDSLYATAIMNSMPDAAEDNKAHVLRCLGAVVVTATRSPLSISHLASLLHGRIARSLLERVAQGLSSVLYMDQKLGDAIRIYHPSFMDYLTNRDRSKELWVDLEQQNTILAECCLDVMLGNLRFNICGLETSYGFNSDVPDLTSRVEAQIPGHLSYSCLYWSSHVASAQPSTLEERLAKLLFGRELMYWMEVLSLLGGLSTGPASLLEFAQCQVSEGLPDYRAVANDAYRFMLSFYDSISKSAPHLYISALAFAPVGSMIARRMRPCFPNLLSVMEGAEKDWTPCLRTISASSAVWSVIVSLDGRRIISGCADGAVQVWDAGTGDTILGPLQGHSGEVNSVALSPDSRWIASGADDETIRVWDAQTGDA
ncbi:hypothetical protein FRC07_004714, partial [Ceratobasidium sp. 392]